MSAAAGAGGAAAAAAAMAARRRKRMHAVEEDLARFGAEDLDGWEFKILRSWRPRFDDPEQLAEVLEVESGAGWELFEKFDGHRVRLKRPASVREHDDGLGPDPYRIWIGVPPNVVGLWTLLVLSALLVALVAFAQAAG